MKPGISVDKVTKKVKKTVKKADNRIKDFNKFITGKVADFSKVKLPEPVTFFKAKAFIKSLDRLQGAKGSGSSGFGGGFMDKMLPISAGSALLTMGALAFAPPTEEKGTTETVLQEQYGGDKNKMKKELSAEKKKAEEGQKTFDDVAEQRKSNIDKTVKNLASVKSNQPKSLTGGLMKKEEDDSITKKEKLDVDKFYKLSKELEQLVDSGLLMRAMGPSFWEWSGDRARDMLEGTKRITGGTLDALTFNWFDFDKKNEPERTVDKDGFPRADGALDEENFSKIKLNYTDVEALHKRSNNPNKKHDEDNYDRDGNKINIGDRVGYGSFKPTSSVFPSNETLLASTGGGELTQPSASTASMNLGDAAASLKGMSSATGPDGGANGCAWAVNKVYKKAGLTPPWGNSLWVPNAEQAMLKKNYKEITDYAERQAGDIMIMYDNHATTPQAHIGVVLPNGDVLSNSSSRASFSWQASPQSYNDYYGNKGKIYRSPEVINNKKPSETKLKSSAGTVGPTTLADQKSGVVPIQVALSVPEEYPFYNKTRGIVNNNTYLISQAPPDRKGNAVVVSGGNQGGGPQMVIMGGGGLQMSDLFLTKLGYTG